MKFHERNPLAVMAYGLFILIVVFGTIVALTGCATLEPDAVRVYAEHESHVGQHFGSDATQYGANLVSVEAHWQRGPAFIDVAEGYNFHGSQLCVGVCGGRETFTARAGLEVWTK